MIGDLALIGTRIQGKVIANKPGHFVNTQGDHERRFFEALLLPRVMIFLEF